MSRTKQTARVPRGPTADEAAERQVGSGGLILGFPTTRGGALPGGANDADDTPDAKVLTLDEVNERFKRQCSLKGPLLREKGRDSEAPADGSKGGLSKKTLAQLAGVRQRLRALKPGAPFALLMHDPEGNRATVRSDAGVPCVTEGGVVVEFGVANFQAETLAFLDGVGARPLVLKGFGYDPSLGCGVYATRNLREGEPVDYDGGVLWEAPDFDEVTGGTDSDMQLQSHELSKSLLAPFGYKGPDLVSALTTHAGYNLHYNDPTFYESPSRHAAEVTDNIAPFLVFDLRTTKPLQIGVLYITNRAVVEDEELLQDWGQDTWASLSAIYLDGMARCSHWYHRYEMRLRLRALKHHLWTSAEAQREQLKQVPPVSGELISFNPSEGGKFGIADYVVDKVGAAGLPAIAYVPFAREQREKERELMLDPSEGLRVLSDAEVVAAFASANCKRSEKVDVTQLPSTSRERLASFADLFKQPSTEAELKIIRGEALLKVSVAEVLETFSPPRWISAPDTAAYALVVSPGERLKFGESVCLYAGKMWTRAGFEAQFKRTALQYYAYDLPPLWSGVDVEKHCKKTGVPKPPDLTIESLHEGGVSRFINDCWGRKDGKKAVNVEPRAVWDPVLKLPVIMMVVTKRGGLGPNEELISDYGPEFWKIVWRELRVFQTEFWRSCSARVSYLERRLRDANVPLPKLPEALAGPLFIGSAPELDPDEDDGEDAEEPHEDGESEGRAAAAAAAAHSDSEDSVEG